MGKPTTYNPTMSPSINPTFSMPTTAPSTFPTTYSPTYKPSHSPTLSPITTQQSTPNNTKYPTTEPTFLPTEIPTFTTKKPTKLQPQYISFLTTSHRINEVIESLDNDEKYDAEQVLSGNYEYVELTVFSSVIAVCFCTVFSFLAYLTFKRRLKLIKKKKKKMSLNKDKNINSPKYKLEINGIQKEKELELKIVRSPTESHSNTYNVKSDKPRALTMNYLRSPTNLSSQRTPSRNKGNISKSLTAISPGRSHLDFDHILNKMEVHKSQ